MDGSRQQSPESEVSMDVNSVLGLSLGCRLTFPLRRSQIIRFDLMPQFRRRWVYAKRLQQLVVRNKYQEPFQFLTELSEIELTFSKFYSEVAINKTRAVLANLALLPLKITKKTDKTKKASRIIYGIQKTHWQGINVNFTAIDLAQVYTIFSNEQWIMKFISTKVCIWSIFFNFAGWIKKYHLLPEDFLETCYSMYDAWCTTIAREISFSL